MNNLYSEFNLQNVKCAGCVSKIEGKLNQLAGISEAKVNLLDKTLSVKYTTQNMDNQVILSVKNLGFGATHEKIIETKIGLWLSVAFPVLVGIFIMTFGMIKILMPDYTTFNGFITGSIESCLTLILLILTGKSIYKSGLNGFRTLNFNMHSLIILGISAAWLYSTWVILISYFSQQSGIEHVYFESALIIVGLINLGTYLEEKAKAGTTTAIKLLIALQPNETTIIKDQQEQLINTHLLRNDDIVVIKPGESIPADGLVTDGHGYVDESMLTGEPLAIHKKPGDKVIAGSINSNGRFTFKVQQIGNNTLLAEIIRLVKTAQMSKPQLAKLADKIAKVFVPAIMLIALLTAAIWWFIGPEPRLFYTVSSFMTILIIACPCSVGLAVPVALMVGLGRSATHGILIKDASCLNKLDKLDYVLLDKTGTITEGKPTVLAFTTDNENMSNHYILLAKALENNSEHPLASAILSYKSEIKQDMQVKNFNMVAGHGISGIINNKIYFIGSRQWISKHISDTGNLFVNNHFTQVFLADIHNILARIDISDTIKPDSAIAIQQLQQNGISVAMVTGDNQENANYIAQQVGLSTVYANCTPPDKINIVKSLQQNHTLAFVGDGINDAPSLVQADVGIAIGSGTDIAMQSADITLMHSSLTGVNTAINIGRAINRNMKQNLFGSFIYNIIAVIIATGVFYPVWHVLLNPIIASIAMSLSSITVILNATRLRKQI